MSILTKIFGDPNQRFIKRLNPTIKKINSLESRFEKFSREDFSKQTEKFRERLKDGQTLDDLLPEAFALVREAAKRTLGMRHFDVQLIGGIVLHQGMIAEMKTGEGKTLVATLPAYLNALTGKNVHLVTVNDYLAKRDTNWMGPIYHLLGVSAACLNHEKSYRFTPTNQDRDEITIEMENLQPVSRREAYQSDIVYGTNNEFGFDYLRDNLIRQPEELAQQEHHFAIIDEIDSILIDEARTPLIISAADTESTRLYQTFTQIVQRLKENEDYNVDEKMRAVTLTETGIEKVEKILGFNIYDENGIKYVHHLEKALQAKVLFKKDRDYIVKDGQVIIVDEFTGRLMPGRRFSEGLHQAIEAKEKVEVKKESRTLASITLQNYFRMYKKLAGMTGTAYTSAEEFSKVYNLDVVRIPTHQPMIRVDLPDSIYRTEEGKFQSIAREIKKRYQKGQPLLVGTVSIEKNEYLSALLKRIGIPHEVLNAKNNEREAQIIAQAGKKEAVTIATNMAGRGVDIILGGHPSSFPSLEEWEKAHQEVVKLGGLHIIGTERHESRRIDDQLRGRSGRQGDPGSSQFFVSLEDRLMRIFASEKIKKMMQILKIPEDMPIENKMISRAIENAQNKVEGFNFDIRKHLLEYDDVVNKQRGTIYSWRRKILLGEIDLPTEYIRLSNDLVSDVVGIHCNGPIDKWNLEEVAESVSAFFNLKNDIHSELENYSEPKLVKEYILGLVKLNFESLIKERKEEIKNIFLSVIDYFWMEHLEEMDYLKESVRLRAYGQKDPLVEYRNEGRVMFDRLMNAIRDNIIKSVTARINNSY